MVGQLTLDQHIGVRIPGGQPIFSAIPKDSRFEFFCALGTPGAESVTTCCMLSGQSWISSNFDCASRWGKMTSRRDSIKAGAMAVVAGGRRGARGCLRVVCGCVG